jgi:hypothetical protein
MKTLRYNDKVRMSGMGGFFAVFTYAGYCGRYNESPEVARERDRKNGNDASDLIQECATVIHSGGSGMREWDNAPVLSVGESVIVDGRPATIRENRPRHITIEYA